MTAHYEYITKEGKLCGPQPVGAKLIKRLKVLRGGDRPWDEASAQHYSLDRMGYVRMQIRVGREYALITNAGLALLERTERAAYRRGRAMTTASAEVREAGRTETGSFLSVGELAELTGRGA